MTLPPWTNDYLADFHALRALKEPDFALTPEGFAALEEEEE